MCQHNYDIKCILSGKATQVAVFYITDYITKVYLKTHEMLSLMSQAVASTPATSVSLEVEQVKMVTS